MSKQKNTKRKISVMWGFLRGSKKFFLISIIVSLVTELCDMLTPQIIRITLDNCIGSEEPKLPAAIVSLIESIGGFKYIGHHLWIPAITIIGIAVIKVVSQYFERISRTLGAETLVKTMRDTLFSRIERLPYSFHMSNKTGDIIQRCTSDIDTMKNFVSEQLISVFRIVIMLTLSLIFMFSMNPYLTLIAMAPLPIVMIYSFVFHNKIGEGFEKCDVEEGRVSATVQENLTGVRVVRAFGREKYELDKFGEKNDNYTALWVKLAKVMSRFWATSDILVGTQILLLIVVGAVFCVRGWLTTGEFLAFISYNSMLVWPIRQLGRMISEMSKTGVSIDRIMLITEEKEEADPDAAVCPPMDRDIVFDNVSFAYPGANETIHNVSFGIKAGSTLGILGGTGSGKSTLMLLLDKLYDLPNGQGKITVGGVDIRKIKTSHLRNNIGLVLQEPYLFSRTIAENIGIASDGITDDEIRDAARAACLDETIGNFSAGYETMVGERGVTLSGGQKQRTAIARNLTRKTPIMIFDDSLSAVDTETDAAIRAELSKRFGGATVILISHRITTLSGADKIIVLENGRIVEEGTHATLSTSGGLYQKIYETQSGMAAGGEDE